jgi:lipoprotein-anchoring transpeptidase ErfK/SrfK
MKSLRWLVIAGLIVILAVSGTLFFKKHGLPLKIRAGSVTSASELSNQARELEAKGNFYGAKSAYEKLINEFANSAELVAWQKKTEEMNIKLLFSTTLTPNSALYEIKPGDTVVKIAREYKTTPELIMKSNGLSGDKIFPGKKIKVWTAPFSILVDKSQNTLIVKSNEEIIKTYIVSTGINNSTPVGTFKIINKLINPTWFKAGAVVVPGSPENVLGSRWLGLDLSGYGIHGTTEPQSLGKQVTQGCVRMANPDVEELYIFIPAGTEVTIVD